MSNLWKSSCKDDQKLFTAIKQSDLFSEDRIETFVKFNYRTVENKDINYSSAYQKILNQKNKLFGEKNALRGTMSVSELWSEGNLQ